MTSSLDGAVNFVETDSCTEHSWNDYSSLEAQPSTSWDSSANFARRYQENEDVSNSSRNVIRQIKNIPPPPPPQHQLWQYPEYVTFASRFATFWDWPRYLKGPNKKDLARAGFIYTQIGDKVTCFCCRMTLKNWEPIDDAYQEHLRWSKNCQYAQMVSDGKNENNRKGMYARNNFR
ncbi:baculoviral IAP repeat-containing protein 3-like [Saccostrea echinata]|uniref:baculoviral IAP repeat-containing protein 3-like n=1 Tax=Saccostrea echinata TaxID=191078 RepID=UPI002A82C29D|nr:baculoviral IAP repeat-containing protein 3-like [Saccostrea echinata]